MPVENIHNVKKQNYGTKPNVLLNINTPAQGSLEAGRLSVGSIIAFLLYSYVLPGHLLPASEEVYHT